MPFNLNCGGGWCSPRGRLGGYFLGEIQGPRHSEHGRGERSIGLKWVLAFGPMISSPYDMVMGEGCLEVGEALKLKAKEGNLFSESMGNAGKDRQYKVVIR